MTSITATTTSEDKTLIILFQNARMKIEEIKHIAKEGMKTIIGELAHNLEEKVTLDNICLMIKHELAGNVSARFVDKCLDEKYKKMYRVQNAKRQKKILEESNLAEPVPLEPKDNNDEIDIGSEVNLSRRHSEAECISRKDLLLRIEELENALSKASQPRNLEVIEFEFSLGYSEVQKYMARIFQQSGTGGLIWFNIKVEKTSGRVMTATIGKISDQIAGQEQAELI